MPAPRLGFGLLFGLAAALPGGLASIALAADAAQTAPAPARLVPGEPLEASLAPGDRTGQRFTAVLVPDRDGPWTVALHSLVFDPSLEIHERQPDGSSKLLARMLGTEVVTPTLVVQGVAGKALAVVVVGQEEFACGSGFQLTATAGVRPARSNAEREETARLYWEEVLTSARSRDDAACEVRGLLGQHAKARRDAQFADALSLVDRAIALAEENVGRESAFLAWAVNAKGRLLHEQGQDDAALPLMERSVAILEARYGPRHPVTADALESLAAQYGGMDRDHDSAAMYERVLEIRKATLPPDDMDIGWAMNDVAAACVASGDLARASLLIEQVVAMAEARTPPDPEDISSILNNLAWVRREMGDNEGARRTYERALEMQRELPAPSKKSIARMTSNLARVMENLGDPAAARRLYDEALELQTAIYGANHTTPAGIELRIARLLARDGHFDEARTRAAAAEAVFETSLGPRHTRTATALASQAVVERLAGRPDAALGLVDRAVAIGEATLGPAHPDLAGPLRLRAALDLDLGRSDAALAAALRAEELGRDQMRLAARSLAQDQALRYAATRSRGLDVALRIAATATDPSPDLDRMVWDSLIRSRALVLDEMARRRELLSAGDPGVARLRDDLAQAGARLARLLVHASEADAPGDLLARIESARHERDRKEEDLAASSSVYQSGRRSSAAGLSEIQHALSPGEALVSYARLDLAAGGAHHPGTPDDEAPPDLAYIALVTRGVAGAPHLLRLGNAAAVEAAVTRWRVAMTPHRPGGLAGARAAQDRERLAAGNALREAVWDPIAAALGEMSATDGGGRIATAFVVPDGALSLVNLAALPTAGNRYLVETDPAIRMLSAERDLATTGAAPARAPRALVIGGPDFDAGPGALTARVFPPLPEASAEASDVAAALRRSHVPEVNLMSGADATVAAFKRLAPKSRYVHVATHTFWTRRGLAEDPSPPGIADALVRGVENPLDFSGMALAGANRRAPSAGDLAAGSDPPGDGILTADEVATLDLAAADWVVLSGCDTGVGASAPGEGLLGLQRAFRVAGARGLVVSLWEVPDLATREWMKLVYAEGRAGASPSAALQGAARKWLSAERRAGGPTSPEVWGAFIATGPDR